MQSRISEISSYLEKILLNHAVLTLPINRRSKEIRRLAEAVHSISDQYISAESSLQWQLFKKEELRRAYLLYYLPVNLVKLHPVLDELFSHPDIKCFEGTSVSILDLGCGPGTFLLGFLEYIAKNKVVVPPLVVNVELWGVDQVEENVAAAKKIIAEYISSGPFPAQTHWNLNLKSGSITSPRFPYPLLPKNKQFEIIIAGNVLAELDSETSSSLAQVLEQLLAPHGTLILIDPGTRKPSRNLIRFRDILIEQPSLKLYAPCLDQGQCPAFDNLKDWCHQKLTWNPPHIVTVIDQSIGFTKGKGIQYSYFTFRKDGKSICDLYQDLPREKIWRVVSYPI
ncbi:MAG: methyltransferase domain-containing protein, partial [Proteobacteria bacterium]|nr:methyltransferase domain-containing protein [Pseudomonadota bacterium]